MIEVSIINDANIEVPESAMIEAQQIQQKAMEHVKDMIYHSEITTVTVNESNTVTNPSVVENKQSQKVTEPELNPLQMATVDQPKNAVVDSQTAAVNPVVKEAVVTVIKEAVVPSVKTAVAQKESPVVIRPIPEAFDFKSALDQVAVIAGHAAQAAGFTAGIQVVKHTERVCDIVYVDDRNRRMTVYVKNKEEERPSLVVDLEGFPPGGKECQKKMDELLKYLTSRGVVVRPKRRVHNKPEGVLRKKLNEKRRSKRTPADKRKLVEYLTRRQSNKQHVSNHN